MMETKAIIKQRIQQHMAAKGVTLTELAERIPGKNGQGHMSKGSLSAMINSGSYTLKSLEKIAEALGVPVVELFEQPDTTTASGSGFVTIEGKRFIITLTPSSDSE
jgi:transcriptional regulator with XRE-family HTH domain